MFRFLVILGSASLIGLWCLFLFSIFCRDDDSPAGPPTGGRVIDMTERGER